MSAKKTAPDVPDHVIESLARSILPGMRAYFESEEGEREFAEWKENRGTENKEADVETPE